MIYGFLVYFPIDKILLFLYNTIHPLRGPSVHFDRRRQCVLNPFSYDGLLVRFLNLVADLVALHVLWLLCSLPIVTIGASTTALYYASMRRIRTDESHVHQNFFRSFRQNFRQSTILWLMMLVVGAVLLLDFRLGMAMEGPLSTAVLVVSSIVTVPFLMTSLYVFPVVAKFHNPIRAHLKNAFLMSFLNFPYTLLLAMVLGTFVFFSMHFIPFLGLVILCGAGIYGYLTSGIFVQVFRKYLPDELEQDMDKTDLTYHG